MKRISMYSVMVMIIAAMGISGVWAQQTLGDMAVEQPAQRLLLGDGSPYTLGKTDVVEITVRNQPEFSGGYEIGPDGMIQYSFVGDIQAEGLTKNELRDVVVSSLERYVKTPEVSVTIAEYRSKNVYILGEVAHPGRYPLRGDSIALSEAIYEAGLPYYSAALRRVYVIKPDETSPEYRKIDLFKILYKGYTKNDIDLVPGDIVVIPSTVPTEINRALSNFLAPIGRARDMDELRMYRWGASDDD